MYATRLASLFPESFAGYSRTGATLMLYRVPNPLLDLEARRSAGSLEVVLRTAHFPKVELDGLRSRLEADPRCRTVAVRPDLAGVEVGVESTQVQVSLREEYVASPVLVVVRRPLLF